MSNDDFLTPIQLLNGEALLPIKAVNIPNFGKIRLRGLNVEEATDFYASVGDVPDGDVKANREVMARLLSLCLIDDRGGRIVPDGPDAWRVLLKWPNAALQAAAGEAAKLNRPLED